MSVVRISWLVAARVSRSLTYLRARTMYFSAIKSHFPVDGRFVDEIRVSRCRSHILTQDLSLLRVCRRYKSGKKSKRIEEDESEDEDEDLVEDSNTKINTTQVNSMRIDLIVKATLGMARNKAEIALYESRIRINGQKVLKKSLQVHIGDTIDLIRGPSPKNPNFLLVSRVTVLAATSDNEAIRIKYSRDKSLLIDQYENDEDVQ